jgi:hypothetical protein
MPFSGNKWSDSKFVSYQDMLSAIRARFPTLTRLADAPSDTSKTWHVPGFPGACEHARGRAGRRAGALLRRCCAARSGAN